MAKRLVSPKAAKGKEISDNECEDKKGYKVHKHISKLEYNNNKAGLQKVNKQEVQRVIEEASRGSAFYESERKREELRKERNQIVLERARQFEQRMQKLQEACKKRKAPVDTTEKEWIEELRERVANCTAELERERDLTKRYVHIDMDMFYAAVEEKRDPTLHLRPFAVGSFSMLCTSNYIARQYGVRSGMPGFIAKKLCPQLYIIRPDFTTYTEVANVVRGIAEEYDPQYISVGLDELTMDVTKYLEDHPKLTVSMLCEQFRRKVFAQTQLTCSGGIAPTAALAKIASNVNKPNGQYEVELHTRAEVIKYLACIPIREIPGIGFAQESLLNALGITECKHFLQKKELLCYLFKEKTFAFYLSIGLGLVRTRVDRALSERKRVQRKSIHKECTINHRIRSAEEAHDIVQSLFSQAYETLLSENAQCRRVVLVVKTRSFDLHSTQHTLPCASNSRTVLWSAIKQLLEPIMTNYELYRLLGVSFHNLAFDKGNKKGTSTHCESLREENVESSDEKTSSLSKSRKSYNASTSKSKEKRQKTHQYTSTQKKVEAKKSKMTIQKTVSPVIIEV